MATKEEMNGFINGGTTSSVDSSTTAGGIQQGQSLPAELRQLLGSSWAKIEQDTIKLLQKLIQTDTQNMQEEGTEMDAVHLLEEIFNDAGVEYEVVEGKPGRGNIVARVKGDGSLQAGPLLLSSHLDTVKAPKENWEMEGWRHNPYSGEIDEEDGCLYGRGAIDMKHMAAMSVILLCFIKKNNIILSRDLIFAGVADEERTDSKWGAKYLVENHPELIEADIVFNEVGGFTINVQGIEGVVVQIAEKGSMQVKITSRGPGGHGSIFHSFNPIATIGEVAHKLQATKLPLRINAVNAATVESMAACLPFPKSAIFRQILNQYLSDVILTKLVPDHVQSSIGPLLRNTANPTSIGGGGEQHNQIPTSAWVILDSRILPECTPEDVIDDIKSVLGLSKFNTGQGSNGEEIPAELNIEILKSRGPCYQNPKDAKCRQVLSVIEKVIEHRADGAVVCPTLIPGATDSYWYSQHPTNTPVCIGFTPMRFDPEVKFSDLFHGTNERIPVNGLKWGIRVLIDVVYILCKAKMN